MLKQPDRSVTAVMEEIGYSNITHFYKIFEKKFHMTPAEYRNTLYVLYVSYLYTVEKKKPYNITANNMSLKYDF